MIGLILGLGCLIKGFLTSQIQLAELGALLYLAGAFWVFVETSHTKNDEEEDSDGIL